VVPQFWREFAKISEIFKNLAEKFIIGGSVKGGILNHVFLANLPRFSAVIGVPCSNHAKK